MMIIMYLKNHICIVHKVYACAIVTRYIIHRADDRLMRMTAITWTRAERKQLSRLQLSNVVNEVANDNLLQTLRLLVVKDGKTTSVSVCSMSVSSRRESRILRPHPCDARVRSGRLRPRHTGPVSWVINRLFSAAVCWERVSRSWMAPHC